MLDSEKNNIRIPSLDVIMEKQKQGQKQAEGELRKQGITEVDRMDKIG
jgi:hypothetical protein